MKRSRNSIVGVGLLIILFLSGTSCNSQSGNKAEESGTSSPIAEKEQILITVDASKLLSTTCYACHNPASASHDEMLAPPLAGIKLRYMKASESRMDFIGKMTSYVSNPTEESALMKGPIKRFGLMPKTALSEEEIRSIVTFIYDNELPAPDWFAEHEKEMHGGK